MRAAKQRLLQASVRPTDQLVGPPLQAWVVLHPFTASTSAEVAADLLLQHASYHLQLGFHKVIQYTQARPGSQRVSCDILIPSRAHSTARTLCLTCTRAVLVSHANHEPTLQQP